ncbi:MAG: hypothetical protein OXF61_00225 [Acidimicrobiaceae bacterium]|nr:hypothetical protein [Acidimicrobiaceae bacterium]
MDYYLLVLDRLDTWRRFIQISIAVAGLAVTQPWAYAPELGHAVWSSLEFLHGMG